MSGAREPTQRKFEYDSLLLVLLLSPPPSLLCLTMAKTRAKSDKTACKPLLVFVTAFAVAMVVSQTGSTLSYLHRTLANDVDDSFSMQSTVLHGSSLSYDMAKKESEGFFDDISDHEWLMLKQKVNGMYPNTLSRKHPSELRDKEILAKDFFQGYFEPDFSCRHERRIGRNGDGGKWLCDPHRLQNKSCLVYSVGSNGDVSFEQAVFDEIGPHCEIHTFDPGRFGATVMKTGAIYHEWGLGKETMTIIPNASDPIPRLVANITNNMSPRQQEIHRRQQKLYRIQQKLRLPQKFKTLKDTVRELGHDGRTIDVFKIDCEGCEFETYQQWFQAGVQMRQILIEIHSGALSKRFPDHRMIKQPETMDFFNFLYHQGYVITHKEVNIMHWYKSGQCAELAFLKLAPEFFPNITELKA